ncbi:hypothetical protein I7I50_12624 [Histoplasma capsulatum G186AR]|uniref:Uncharacterized protein n=1 Tax=Ajellomyces capsulatus TaxID=5037 RepID=A0A8H7Y7X4_AJECA|nr:hypothetical protein I7I52_11071 [Histoplasma capsulatum]QSS70854.1 hypothetical protein I7I50_12624 [Histoplasma capsulatum G186AR]
MCLSIRVELGRGQFESPQSFRIRWRPPGARDNIWSHQTKAIIAPRMRNVNLEACRRDGIALLCFLGTHDRLASKVGLTFIQGQLEK